MFRTSLRIWPILFLALIGAAPFVYAEDDQTEELTWTLLQPEHDSRATDVQVHDDADSQYLVQGMNEADGFLYHRLIWKKLSISQLLIDPKPFCELRFDAVTPLFLTPEEKEIIRQYFARGGFILFAEDTYPYEQDVFWKVRSWPVIDFLTKELPAEDPNFTVEKITDDHAIFHQYYATQTADAVRHELLGNPYTPNRNLLSYRGHPCAFVWGRYGWFDGEKWLAMPRPFPDDFSYALKSYELVVNIYVYAMMH